MRQLVNLANLLSFSRLVMAPLAVNSIVDQRYWRALLIFAAAGITDFLDGRLARHFQWSTRLGQYLDPIADKVLLVAVYLALGAAGLMPWWLVGIVLGRDILLLAFAGAAILLTRHRSFPPSIWGKISTFVQMTAAVVVIAARATGSAMLEQQAGDVLMAIVAAATIWSGLHYAWRGRYLFGHPEDRGPA